VLVWLGWNWEGTQPGQLTPADQRDSPYRVMSCAAAKAGGRRKRGMFGVMAFVFPSYRARLSWGQLDTCLPMGSSERIPHFALLARTDIATLVKLSLSEPTSFLTFTLPILTPSRREGACKRLRGAELPAGVKLQHLVCHYRG